MFSFLIPGAIFPMGFLELIVANELYQFFFQNITSLVMNFSKSTILEEPLKQ